MGRAALLLTCKQDGWRVVLVLVAAPILLILAGWRPLERRAASETLSLMPHSVLLDWDLPGALPHDQSGAATARLQQSAAAQGLPCGAVKVYRIEAPERVTESLHQAQAERHFLRFRDRKNPALSRWDGPNRLWMVEAKDELLICALDWPMIG